MTATVALDRTVDVVGPRAGWSASRVWRCVSLRRLRSVPAVAPAELSDVELIARVDDDSCLRELIGRHQRSLRQLARSMLRNDADADEAVQDTFVAVFRSAASFRGESAAKTWLHSICYRQCLARLRRKRFDVVPLDVDFAVGAIAVEVDHTFNAVLDAAVRQLPEPNRVAFVLVDVLGWSREDAAGIVGVPGNTMRARVARARELLADALGDDDETGEVRS